MSVVDSKPEKEHFVKQFQKDIRHYKVHHLSKSGITGWAQVNGWRGDTSIDKRVEHDIYYIENSVSTLTLTSTSALRYDVYREFYSLFCYSNDSFTIRCGAALGMVILHFVYFCCLSASVVASSQSSVRGDG